ncbi:MAG: TatD family hydrolase [Candidatus Omnitrophota bacterium]
MERMRLADTIDTHCHLDSVEPLNEALQAACDCGVSGIIAVGEDITSNTKILEIAAQKYPVKIYPAIGLHPGKVTFENYEENIEFIKKNIGKVIAIGESGLDFWINSARKDLAQRELQIKSFKAQIALANKHNLPLSAHTRGAWAETLEIARQEGLKKCIFHWFTGPFDVLNGVLDAGYYISATPAAEYSPQLIETIKNCPFENLLIETDSPVIYKPETGHFKSQPKDLIRTIQAVAKIKGKPEAEVAIACNKTAKELFNLST